MAKTRKTRYIKKQTRKITKAEMNLIEAKHYIEEYKTNPKIHIYKIVTGRKGFNMAQSMLFLDDVQGGIEWANRWSNDDKNNAVFVIYSRKLRKNVRVHIELHIGTGEDKSVIGEKKPLEEALRVWSGQLS